MRTRLVAWVGAKDRADSHIAEQRMREVRRKSSDAARSSCVEVRKAREIIECHMVIGWFDYLVKARIADMAMFQEFLQRVILPLTGVRETTLTHQSLM